MYNQTVSLIISIAKGEMMSHKIHSITLFILVLVLATACNPVNKTVTLTAVDKGSQVDVNVGQQIVIALDGNPSTGFTWEAKDLDTTMFEEVGDPAFNSSNPGSVGSGGTLTLTFKALKAGTSNLTLIYHRPWETGVAPIDTFTVTLTVK